MESLNVLFFIVGLVLGIIPACYCYIKWQKKNLALDGVHLQLKNTEETRDAAVSERNDLREEHLSNVGEIAGLKARIEEIEKQTPIFENLAAKALEKSNAKFSVESQKSIKELLTPLKENIGNFNKRIEDSFGNASKERHALTQQVERIMLEANSLTSALRGDSKAQGNWGEIMLERILEESGLSEGQGYTLQAAGMGLVNDDGQRIHPDAIIHLPEGKHLIIDSKVSLTNYEKYVSEDKKEDQEKYLKLFINSVRNHIKELSDKKYHTAEKLGTPDFVMMFMPIEGAYLLAIQKDPDIHKFAWERKIALVCHSTLFMSMKTVDSLWKQEAQSKNALEIAKKGGALHDKFVGFVDNIEEIGKHLDKSHEAYEGALKKLSSGQGNLISRVNALEKLGVKAQKKIPEHLVNKGDKSQEEVKSLDSTST